MITHIYVVSKETKSEDIVTLYKKAYDITKSTEHYITPQETKKELVIEQMRDLLVDLRYQYSNPLIVCIDGMDRSSLEVQNILLKTLEEHQENVHIVLPVQSIHSLVSTIVSRCKVVYLSSQVYPMVTQADIDASKLSVESVELFLIDQAQKARDIQSLAYILRHRQLLLNNNVSAQTVYDSVLIFLQKRSSMNT